jgi:hypothetical protein
MIQSARSRLAGAFAGGEDEVRPAGDGHGWASWDQMHAVALTWLAELSRLSDTVAAAGESLSGAADSCDNTDERAAAAVRGHRADEGLASW